MNKKGFTLLEMIIAFAVLATLMTGIAKMQSFFSKSYSKNRWAVLTRQKLKTTFKVLKSYIQKASYLTAITDVGAFYLGNGATGKINRNTDIKNVFYTDEGYIPTFLFSYYNGDSKIDNWTIIKPSDSTDQILMDFYICRPYISTKDSSQNASATRVKVKLEKKTLVISLQSLTGTYKGYYTDKNSSEKSTTLVTDKNIFSGTTTTIKRKLLEDISEVRIIGRDIIPIGEMLDSSKNSGGTYRTSADQMNKSLTWQKRGLITFKVKIEQDSRFTKVNSYVTDEFTTEVPVQLNPDNSL